MIMIREGQKHVLAVDLDPQHCFGLKDPDRDPDPYFWRPLTSTSIEATNNKTKSSYTITRKTR
jgi:hypothetical protein